MGESWTHRAAGLGRRAVAWGRADPPRLMALALGVLVLAYATHWFFESKHPRGSTAEPSTDGRYYYAYLPSLVFDRDLDLENEYRVVGNFFRYPRTETGRPGNVFAIGPALYALPTYLGGHVLARWRGERADGYSKTEKAGAMLASLLFSLGALLFAWRLIRRRLPDSYLAPLVPLLLAVGGPVVYYAIRQPGYSHPFAAFWTAWLVDAWDASFDEREEPRRYRTWVLLGALLGLAALARTQLVLWGALLLWAAGDDFRRAYARASWPRRWLGALRVTAPRWAVGAVAALVAFGPQLVTWKVIYGSFFLIPQGAGFLRWDAPAWSEVLFSARNGLLPWAPLYALAFVGLFGALRRMPRLASGLLVGVALQVLTNGAVWDWWGGVALGARRFDSCFAAFAFGLGFLLVRPTWQGRRHVAWRAARTAAVGALLLLVLTLAWGNLTYVEKMNCTTVRGHLRGPASRILRKEIGGPSGRVVGWASGLANLPARLVFAWRYGTGLEAYDHVVGRHVLNERYPWPKHRRGKPVHTMRFPRPDDHHLVGFVRGPHPRTIAMKGSRARILFGLNLVGAVRLELRASHPGAEPVDLLLRLNGDYLARARVGRGPALVTGRVRHARRGTSSLEVLAPAGTVLHWLRFRHEGPYGRRR